MAHFQPWSSSRPSTRSPSARTTTAGFQSSSPARWSTGGTSISKVPRRYLARWATDYSSCKPCWGKPTLIGITPKSQSTGLQTTRRITNTRTDRPERALTRCPESLQSISRPNRLKLIRPPPPQKPQPQPPPPPPPSPPPPMIEPNATATRTPSTTSSGPLMYSKPRAMPTVTSQLSGLVFPTTRVREGDFAFVVAPAAIVGILIMTFKNCIEGSLRATRSKFRKQSTKNKVIYNHNPEPIIYQPLISAPNDLKLYKILLFEKCKWIRLLFENFNIVTLHTFWWFKYWTLQQHRKVKCFVKCMKKCVHFRLTVSLLGK